MLPLGELKAWHLEKVEEAVAYHVGDGVVHLQQTLAKPGKEQELVLFDLARLNQLNQQSNITGKVNRCV